MNILKKNITYRLVSARKRVDSSFIGHAGMALRCLWAGAQCRRPVRSPLRHAGMSLRYLWAGLPYRRSS